MAEVLTLTVQEGGGARVSKVDGDGRRRTNVKDHVPIPSIVPI